MTRARLARYVAYQLLDFGREKGIAIAFILAALTAAGVQVANADAALGFDGEAGKVRLARFAFQLVTSVSLLFVVIGYSGLCSFDRSQGFGRFYFAKPVDPSAFYTLKWLVHAAGLSAIVAVWLGALVAFYGTFDAMPIVLAFGMRLVLYGGLFFLLSTLVAAEVAVFSGVYLLGEIGKLLAGDRAWAKDALPWLFPWQRLSDLDAQLLSGVTPPLVDVGYIVGVGLAASVGAVVALRVRRLIT